MRIIITCFVFILGGCFAGAGTIDLSDPNIRKGITNVKIYENANGLKYSQVGTVEARYCDSNQASVTKGGNITKEGAITEMRYEASKLGANALIDVVCSTDGINWATNCNNSVRCFGEAVKTEDKL